MNTTTHIECACSQRIVGRDVLTTGYLVQSGTEVFVLVKYRCPRCKKLGQEIINRDQWDWSLLDNEPGELTSSERRLFEQLGPLGTDESLQFHQELAQVSRITEAD